MSRTERLRRLARRLRVEEGRLRKIAAEMLEGNLPLNAREIRRHAGSIGYMSLAMDCLANHIRDARGAQQRSGSDHG